MNIFVKVLGDDLIGAEYDRDKSSLLYAQLLRAKIEGFCKEETAVYVVCYLDEGNDVTVSMYDDAGREPTNEVFSKFREKLNEVMLELAQESTKYLKK